MLVQVPLRFVEVFVGGCLEGVFEGTYQHMEGVLGGLEVGVELPGFARLAVHDEAAGQMGDVDVLGLDALVGHG